MSNKTKVLILTILSSLLTICFYYMSYVYNPRFYSLTKPLYVHQFREQNGPIIILLILAAVFFFSILFINYVIKDSSQLQLYSQACRPEYYKKQNLLAPYRIFQYYVLVSAYVVLIRDCYRSLTYDGGLLSQYIFTTDLLFLMWDVIFILFLALTIILFIEYLQSRKTIIEE